MGQQSINEELKQANVVIQPKVGHLGTLDLKSSNQAILEPVVPTYWLGDFLLDVQKYQQQSQYLHPYHEQF
jgi:hypothetical protein